MGHDTKTSRANRRCQQGLTLVEVLIAVLVLSIGLLGMAGLQTVSMKASQSAYLGSQAAALAYDMADRIRANPDGSYAGQTYAAQGCEDTPNSPIDTADRAEWACLLQQLLPGGNGAVTGGPDDFEITVQWNDPHADDDDAEQLAYTLRVRL